MRKLTALILIGIMVMSLTACGSKKAETGTESNNEQQTDGEQNTQGGEEQGMQELTLANALKEAFKQEAEKNPEASCVDIATAIQSNENIMFSPMVMEVEEGMLTGFGNYSVEGFSDGAVLAPMIGTLPFICYIFTVPEDAKTFAQGLSENCDLNWNICTTADEAVTEIAGNKVFFAMGPYRMEDEPGEDSGTEVVYQ